MSGSADLLLDRLDPVSEGAAPTGAPTGAQGTLSPDTRCPEVPRAR